MLIALLFILLVSTVLFALYIHTQDDNFPFFLTRIVLPLSVGAAISSVFTTYIYTKTNLYLRFLPFTHRALHRVAIALILTCSATLLFQPLASSIRYNVGKVLHLESIEEMPPHQQPTFLSLGEWHVDRMRVIPIHTYENGWGWNRNKVHLKSLFLLPIFSQKNAYERAAKAWLAFKYEDTITKEEFALNRGRHSFEQSVRHFKKINVGAFLYFQLYDQGLEKQTLTQLARRHSYFKSSYSAVYQGNAVDRDLLSLRYFIYTLLALLFFVGPLYWLIVRYGMVADRSNTILL